MVQIVQFCPNCNNILIPKKGTDLLFCRACNVEFKLESKEEYQIIKKIKHNEAESAPIVVNESEVRKKISEDDRKAYEEFFGKTEQPSY